MNNDPRPPAPSHGAQPTGRGNSYIGPNLSIKGEISGHEDLKLDGKVDGLVSVGGHRLTVGAGAKLSADLVAREALIAGEVTGEIRAADRIEIARTAAIVGNLLAGRIVMEEGAYFSGDVEVGKPSGAIGADLDSLLSKASKPQKS